MIMAFWSDADNRLDRSNCRLLYRETGNRTLLRKAARNIFAAFPEMKGISLSWMFIVTWVNLPFFKATWQCDGISKQNTFQLVLTTDGVHSFALMYYNKIQWTTGGSTRSGGNCYGLGGNPAKAGFDYGDGRTLYTIPNSCTPSILNITRTSNINQPGKWVFRVDSNLKAAACQEFATSQKLRLSPNAVSFMGNVPLKLEGPCIPEGANVSCIYHDYHNLTTPITTEVQGSAVHSTDENYLSKSFAVCPMPYFHTLGRTIVNLKVDRINVTGSATLSDVYTGYLFILDDRIVGEHLKFTFLNRSSEEDGNAQIFVKLEWDPTFFQTEIDYLNQLENDNPTKSEEPGRRKKRSISQEKVDFNLESYNGHHFNDFGILKRGIDNNGLFEGVIDKEIFDDFGSLQHPSLFFASMALHNPAGGFNFGKLTAEMGEAYFNYVNATSPPVTTFIANSYCKLWDKFSDPPPNDTRPCPPTAQLAGEDDDFEPDAAGPWMSKLHPGGKSAVRQRIPSDSGAGSQCVYDNDGNLMVGPFGGGTLDRYSPTQHPIRHFFWDVAPYVACCRLSGKEKADKNCIHKYYQQRPSDDGTKYNRSRVTRAVGDPHITTFDGLVYTFNGVGEFWMVKYVDTTGAGLMNFKMQARMEQYISSSSGQAMNASVFTCVVMEEVRNGEGVNVQVTYIDDKISVMLDGDTVDITDITTEFTFRHKSSSVTIHSPEAVTVTFSSSFSFRFSTVGVNEVALNIIGSAKDSRTFAGVVEGLMGNMDGVRNNDLKRPDGKTLLPSNSTPQQIHFDFGLHWLVQEDESLFTYLPGKSYADYSKPDFQPTFIMDMDIESLPQEILTTCGGSRDCLFDYSATGSQSFANETKLASEKFAQVKAVVSRPVKMCSQSHLPKIENGYSLITTLLVGGLATFQCNEGFNYHTTPTNESITCKCAQEPDNDEPRWNCNLAVGISEVICQIENATRDETPPKNLTCQEPDQLHYGHIIGSNYSLGSSVELRCSNSSFELFWKNCNFHGSTGLCRDRCNVTYSCVEQNVTLEDGTIQSEAVWEGYAGDIGDVRCVSPIMGRIGTFLRATSLLLRMTTAMASGELKIQVPAHLKTKPYLVGC